MNIYDEIIASISPLEIAQRYLDLKKSGKNYQSLCPFHPDTKPSLSFDPERGLFYCFGCGKSGNLVHLISEIEGISKFEALKELAKDAGIKLKEDKISEDREILKLFEVLEFALNEYEKILFEKEGEKARNYLEGRGFKLNTIRRFRIGYAPASGDYILKKAREKGINPSLLLEVGLITGLGGVLKDFFKDRIIFPIFNTSSKCIAFGGRAFEGEPKYLNSPDSKIFKKSKNLFGIDIAKNKAKKENTLILVEGYTDVMRMVENGFENTVAPLGTAFSVEQALIMKRFADIIIILFDGDDAGKRGMKRTLPFLLKTNLKVKIAELPPYEDPDSYLKKESREEMEKVLSSSKNFLDALLPENIPYDPYAQSILLNEMIEFISNIPSELERELFIKRVSEKFLISPEYIRSKVKFLGEEKNEGKDTLPSEFSLFGIIASFNKFNKEEIEKRGIDERVFKSELLKRILIKIREGSSLEELLFELSDNERKKVVEAIFKAREKFVNFEKKVEVEPYEFAFEKLEKKMKKILKKEKIFKEWNEYKESKGSNPISQKEKEEKCQ
ncbi:MAG: DNA primase [candidate division WOR-3 bacterium]